jgi:hypothetical protein
VVDVASTTNSTAATTPAGGASGPFGNGVQTPVDFYQNFSNVVGSPHSFLDSADPNDRTFARHMLTSAPLVMFRPGRVKFTNTTDLIALLGAKLGIGSDMQAAFKVGGTSSAGIFDMQAQYGVQSGDLSALNLAIQEKTFGTVQDFSAAGKATSLRFFEFDPRINEYMSVVSTISARIYARMTSLPGSANQLPWLTWGGAAPKPQSYGGFSTFWADNASSVSEGVSAEVGATAVAGIVKGVAETSRTAQYVLGSDWAGGENQKGRMGTALNGILDSVGMGRDDQVAASGIATALGDAILGINPLFPEVWKDSAFSRSYDLSFKFHTPYGTPGAVYQNVLLPFAQLLALVLPMMRNPGTYSEPFCFQLDCPGHFNCDLGICTGFNFIKGGADHLWTKDGLPRQIDVTMQVKDLYPTLSASHNNRSLYCNPGLGSFLDNLAGINLFDATQGLSPLTTLQARIQSAMNQGSTIPNRLVQGLENIIFTRGSVANLFRPIIPGAPK